MVSIRISIAVGLRDFRLEIFGDIHQDTQIGMILNGISRYREESSPYGLFASYRYIGKSVCCAITVCLVDKDWGTEIDIAVIEIGQDENAYGSACKNFGRSIRLFFFR